MSHPQIIHPPPKADTQAAATMSLPFLGGSDKLKLLLTYDLYKQRAL
jgi:hypothetical protein